MKKMNKLFNIYITLLGLSFFNSAHALQKSGCVAFTFSASQPSITDRWVGYRFADDRAYLGVKPRCRVRADNSVDNRDCDPNMDETQFDIRVLKGFMGTNNGIAYTESLVAGGPGPNQAHFTDALLPLMPNSSDVDTRAFQRDEFSEQQGLAGGSTWWSRGLMSWFGSYSLLCRVPGQIMPRMCHVVAPTYRTTWLQTNRGAPHYIKIQVLDYVRNLFAARGGQRAAPINPTSSSLSNDCPVQGVGVSAYNLIHVDASQSAAANAIVQRELGMVYLPSRVHLVLRYEIVR